MTALKDESLLPNAANASTRPDQPMQLDNKHYVTGRPIMAPFEELGTDYQKVLFGLGCFWGAERKFWNTPGVYTTAVGYTGGVSANPTYAEVCTGETGHSEVVLVVFRGEQISFKELLKIFFESHDPTQGMRQGNDLGTQYRSGIYFYAELQKKLAEEARSCYQSALTKQHLSSITTEILPACDFYYAEQYHQQYLAKNPAGYCGIGGTGVSCSI